MKKKIIAAIAATVCIANTAILPASALDLNVRGDVNGDGRFNIADVVTLNKWLLGAPNAKLISFNGADIFTDGIIDVFDMVQMRKELLDFQISVAEPATYYFDDYDKYVEFLAENGLTHELFSFGNVAHIGDFAGANVAKYNVPKYVHFWLTDNSGTKLFLSISEHEDENDGVVNWVDDNINTFDMRTLNGAEINGKALYNDYIYSYRDGVLRTIEWYDEDYHYTLSAANDSLGNYPTTAYDTFTGGLIFPEYKAVSPIVPYYHSFYYGSVDEYADNIYNGFDDDLIAEIEDKADPEDKGEFTSFIKDCRTNGVYFPYMILPNENDEMQWTSISLFARDIYKRPGTFFIANNCDAISYIHVMDIDEELKEDANINGANWLMSQYETERLDPELPNYSYTSYKSTELRLYDRTVDAVVISYPDDPRDTAVFVYDDVLVRVKFYPDKITLDDLSQLSMKVV